MLLDLPLEVLQTILWHMDPGTLFISLFTCKEIFNAAKAKKLLLHQIGSIPGLRLGLGENVPTPELLTEFRLRAAANLLGVGVLADVARYAPGNNLINVRQCVLSPGAPDTPAQLATVYQHHPVVSIYELTADHIRLKAELKMDLIRNGAGGFCNVEVLKVAFSASRDLAVLYRYTLHSERASPFVDEAAAKAKHTLKLVTFHHCRAATKGWFYTSNVQETRDISYRSDTYPVGLALAINGNACIAWKSPSDANTTGVCLYGRDAKLMDACCYDPNPTMMTYDDPPFLSLYRSRSSIAPHDGLIFDMNFVFQGRSLNFYQPGNPIHSWFSSMCNPSSPNATSIQVNRATVLVEGRDWDCYAISMPIHSLHERNMTVPDRLDPICRISYLAIGVSMDNHDAFIVQTEVNRPSASCDHTAELEQGRRLGIQWNALAFLAGWRQGQSSLGTVMAISPGGRRIATADWSKVLVWSIEPDMLHQGALETYFPAHDWNAQKTIGRLRPVRLPSVGVVHSLLWVDEAKLYAMTDRGLVKWNVGHMCSGDREHLSMDYDAWPVDAVAMPLWHGTHG
ncbi:F-box domain [Lasallia pustulata]|uniref:F-box domain n=1 Tax=Lasallia pustulata TaxID=136370 RepID=A0A1W5D6K2_9LECA|nr:F-box domain [Lasallia pustulata]